MTSVARVRASARARASVGASARMRRARRPVRARALFDGGTDAPVASAPRVDAEEVRARSRALVDAFESLDEEARVRLVERVVFGGGRDGLVAPDVRADVGAAGEDAREVRAVEEDVREVVRGDDDAVVSTEPTAEALADLRDFGPAVAAGEEPAAASEALAAKWREVFGEDPPESGGASVDDILGVSEGEGADGVLDAVRRALGTRAYAAERAWARIEYKFGRTGAIVASGLASVSAALITASIFSRSNRGEDDAERSRGSVEPVENVETDASRSAEEPTSVRPEPADGVLWVRKEEKVRLDDYVQSTPSSSTPTANTGVLWTRRETKERKPARERFGPPASGTFDDRNRREDDAPPRILWTRKIDPEVDELDEEYREPQSSRRFEARQSLISLDDNLEDLRAFPRASADRDSPR